MRTSFSAALIAFALLLALPSAALAADSAEGYWRTVPDDDADPSLMKVWVQKDKLFVKVEKIFAKKGNDPNPLCTACKGKLKDKPIVGMVLVNGLSKDDEEWSGGKILDPKSGKFYKCYMKVVEEGKKIKVRGYIGISLFGRTQYWVKAKQ